jgi:MFS family permease
LFSFLWLKRGEGRLPQALILAAVLSVGIAGLSFLIPVTNQEARRRKTFFPRAAFSVIVRPQMLVLTGVGFLAGFVDKFYYFGISPFFHQIGVGEAYLMPAMSVGQITEIGAMALLSIGLLRLGYKKIIGTGLIMEILRFTALIVASSDGGLISVAIAGLTCHGFAYAFIFIAAFIYLNTHSDAEGRTGVQQLFSMGTMGIGGFIGSIIAGKSMDVFSSGSAGQVSFGLFWLVPLIISIAALIVFVLFFNDDGDDDHRRSPRSNGEGDADNPGP